MQLNRADILARLPHAGSMCLLDTVDAYDDEEIICSANLTSMQPYVSQHPLAASSWPEGAQHAENTESNLEFGHTQLSSVFAVEYAAQAAGLHASLSAESANTGENVQPRQGVLAQVKQLQCHSAYLDKAGSMTIATLRVTATVQLASANSWIYQFSVNGLTSEAAAVLLAEGQFTVFAVPAEPAKIESNHAA